MPRRLGPTVPETLRRLLAGDDLPARVGLTLLLLTVDEEGWPHSAMLSAGEVLAPSPDGPELRFALWATSSTTANLGRSGRGTLFSVVPPATYTLRVRARRLPDADVQGHPLALFGARVEEALEDVVTYAEVTSGIAFRLADPERTLAAWRESVEAMRRA
jgi:hypothetical protein